MRCTIWINRLSYVIPCQRLYQNTPIFECPKWEKGLINIFRSTNHVPRKPEPRHAPHAHSIGTFYPIPAAAPLPPVSKHGSLETSNKVTFQEIIRQSLFIIIAELKLKWDSEAAGILQIPTWKQFWRRVWKPCTAFMRFLTIFEDAIPLQIQFSL